MSIIMKTTVAKVGKYSNKFLEEGLLILFSKDDVMSEVKNYSILVDQIEFSGQIEPQQKLYIDNESFEIKAVGSIAEKNLREISHVTFRTGNEDDSKLPGTLYLENKKYPNINEGTIIEIKSKN